MSSERVHERSSRVESDWQELVAKRVALLRYGTVLITVHEGEVVQVDCTDRTRFTAAERSRRNADSYGR